jgi:hypothetical protein
MLAAVHAGNHYGIDWCLNRGRLMKTIRFRYDQEKVMNALAFFARNGVADLDQMKS